jgi:hypothetical protein
MEKLIHVRFSPDGSVAEIGERPAGAKLQEWFDHLSHAAGNSYQALSGGRGLFRVANGDLDAIKGAMTR